MSVALCLSAFPVGFAGVWGLLHWSSIAAHVKLANAPKPLLDLPVLETYPAKLAALLCWLGALGLHLYASRRRRMHIAHVALPALIFALSVAAAFFAPPIDASH
ncbi:hypothetical protein ACN2C7_03600 [Caulobacter sp. ErkDOM-E]|uniref:hypothetical protein n=1 Tax=Caulobacter sp. ErkDOM-E TaxID=3402778 RepID=UPI003AF5075B